MARPRRGARHPAPVRPRGPPVAPPAPARTARDPPPVAPPARRAHQRPVGPRRSRSDQRDPRSHRRRQRWWLRPPQRRRASAARRPATPVAGCASSPSPACSCSASSPPSSSASRASTPRRSPRRRSSSARRPRSSRRCAARCSPPTAPCSPPASCARSSSPTSRRCAPTAPTRTPATPRPPPRPCSRRRPSWPRCSTPPSRSWWRELTGTSRYRILSRDVTPLTWNTISELGIPGIYRDRRETRSERTYPQGSTTAALVGYMTGATASPAAGSS